MYSPLAGCSLNLPMIAMVVFLLGEPPRARREID
jgi:hypothetical protein